MKVHLTFKDPDGVSASLEDFSEGDKKLIKQSAAFKNFIEYEEYVTIELDTETGEARVISNKKG